MLGVGFERLSQVRSSDNARGAFSPPTLHPTRELSMSLFTPPILPQNDTPQNRASRAQTLAQKQTQYVYDYPDIVAGLPMAAAPIPVDISLDWALKLAETVILLGENFVDALLPNLFSFDVQIPIKLGQGSSGATTSSFRVAFGYDAARSPPSSPRGCASGTGRLTRSSFARSMISRSSPANRTCPCLASRAATCMATARKRGSSPSVWLSMRALTCSAVAMMFLRTTLR